VHVEADRQADDYLQVRIDARLWEMATASGFAGSAYDRLLDRVIAYGLAHVRAAVSSGRVFEWCARRNGRIKLYVPGQWTHEDREELVQETVASAARRFHDAGRIGQGWSEELGVTLGAYFLGLCIEEFPNHFRRWLRASRRAAQPLQDVERLPQAMAPDPASIVAAQQELSDSLRPLPASQRAALMLQALGFSEEEIAARLGVSSRAVEGLIYRGRRQLWRQRMGGVG
jgi:DNA-directed RNA polymerase specialized sigma24 family protein